MDVPYSEISTPVEDGLVVRAITKNYASFLGLVSRWDDATLAKKAFESRQIVAVEDYDSYPNRRKVYNHLKLHAVAEVPMIVNNVCIGLLSLARTTEEHPFDEGDLTKALWLAQLAALVLDQRSLYESTLRELKEREKTEKALRESEERYRTLVEALEEGIVLQNREGVILACNKSAEDILGLTIDQMMGRTSIDPRWQAIYENYTPFPGENHPAMITLRTGEPQKDVIMGVYKPSGALTWISINSRPMFNEVDSLPYAVIASFTDITRRKEAEKRALQLAVERQRSSLLAGFIQDASHEFRTPLSIIQTSLYLLNRSADPAIRAEKSQMIDVQVRLINRLVTMLVWQVRLESSQWSALRIGIDLNILINQLIHSLRTEIQNRQHTISLYVVGDDVPLIVGDEEMIEIAIRLLLENAIRYTPNNGKIDVRITKAKGQYEISIQDNGVGISDEVLPQIFTRFYRHDAAHTTPGLGLGLSIAQRIVEEHGGRIEVKSKVEVGSTFTMILPYPVNHA